MFRNLGSAANAVVIVLIILTIGAFSLVQVQPQPVFQILRNVMLAALGASTPGLNIEGEPSKQTLECNYSTGQCRWE
ncbi:MAG: hypothetical protein F6K19_33445 [Cyanothece sp. SIO1E1]|nr:hypothetical protein [Cyanothece sp. SIO1E1]